MYGLIGRLNSLFSNESQPLTSRWTIGDKAACNYYQDFGSLLGPNGDEQRTNQSNT
jgi:hypothetical protein